MSRLKLYSAFAHWNNFDNIWLFSDPHFSDTDCKLMDPDWPSPEEVVKKINSKVGRKDLVICLGDVGDESFIKKLKGYKVLIMGNHDRGESNYLRYEYEEQVDLDSKKEDMSENFHHFRYSVESKLIAELENGVKSYSTNSVKYAVYDNQLFDEVYDGPIFINDKILLSHEPIKIPFGINIHGHTHGATRYEYWTDNSVMINVCLDTREYEPVRLDKVIQGFKTKDIHRLTINNAIVKKGNKNV